MGKLEKTIVSFVYSKNPADRAIGKALMVNNPNFEELTDDILKKYGIMDASVLRGHDLIGTDMQWINNNCHKDPISNKKYVIVKCNKRRKFRIKKEFVIDEEIQEKEGMGESRDISQMVENA